MDGEREGDLRSVRLFSLQYNNSEVYESTLPRYLGKVRYMRYIYLPKLRATYIQISSHPGQDVHKHQILYKLVKVRRQRQSE